MLKTEGPETSHDAYRSSRNIPFLRGQKHRSDVHIAKQSTG